MMGFAQVLMGVLVVIGPALCQEKRVLLHSDADILQRLLHLEQEVQSLKTENAVLKDTVCCFFTWGGLV